MAPAICITADDYGLHAVVNEAIEELARGGHISAVAVMVHDGAALDSLPRLRATGIATGLHLVVTQERPVLRELVGSALAPAGRLPASPYALARALLRRPRLRHLLAAELAAQLDRYRALELPLDFVNSHQHAHEVPLVWPLVADLLDRAGAPAVRAAHLQPCTATQQGALALLSRASWRLRRPGSAHRILSPLGAGQAGRLRLPDLSDLVERGLRWHAGDGALPELVVHPASDDGPLRARYGASAGERRTEYELLRSPRSGVAVASTTASPRPAPASSADRRGARSFRRNGSVVFVADLPEPPGRCTVRVPPRSERAEVERLRSPAAAGADAGPPPPP